MRFMVPHPWEERRALCAEGYPPWEERRHYAQREYPPWEERRHCAQRGVHTGRHVCAERCTHREACLRREVYTLKSGSLPWCTPLLASASHGVHLS